MKRFGCLLSGCLGLGAALAVLVVMALIFMVQDRTPIAPVLSPASPTPVIRLAPATPTDGGDGIVLVTAQTANNTPQPSELAQPRMAGTSPAPVGAPFFTSQTIAAQQSATMLWTARTAWFGSLTQGALDLAATRRVLGTPGQ